MYLLYDTRLFGQLRSSRLVCGYRKIGIPELTVLDLSSSGPCHRVSRTIEKIIDDLNLALRELDQDILDVSLFFVTIRYFVFFFLQCIPNRGSKKDTLKICTPRSWRNTVSWLKDITCEKQLIPTYSHSQVGSVFGLNSEIDAFPGIGRACERGV